MRAEYDSLQLLGKEVVVRWWSVSSPKQQAIGQDEIV